MAFVQENIPYKSTVSNLDNKHIISKSSYLYKKCFFHEILLTISDIEEFIFNTRNSMVVEKVFYRKLGHNVLIITNLR